MMSKLATLSRWEQLHQQLDIQPDANEYQRLIEAYSEPQRAYHTLQHLNECLEKLDWMAAHKHSPIENQPIIEIALWYHDAIYQPKTTDNELKSAEWATRYLKQQQTLENTCQHTHTLIMATCHDQLPDSAEQQRIIDIDLAILGANTERFYEYENQIRKEYNWVPKILYKYKRKKVLRSFLDRPRIYHTPLFHENYEAQARENITLSLQSI